jgi:hypothetical protein
MEHIYEIMNNKLTTRYEKIIADADIYANPYDTYMADDNFLYIQKIKDMFNKLKRKKSMRL